MPVTAVPTKDKDMAQATTTSTDGAAASGEVHAHLHPLPAPSSAVAIEGGDCNEIADAAAAKSDENELVLLIAQPVKEPTVDRN
eukprot:3811859-Pyramimonas_sp.AAC.1